MGWQQELPIGKINYQIRFEPQTSELPVHPQPIILRLLSHYLVSLIPDKGLPELCETAKRISEFYTALPATIEPPRLSYGEVRTAKQEKSIERPRFSIPEE